MIYRADHIVKAINDALEADGGAAYRTMLGKVIPMMDDAYRGHSSPFRSHLGASLLGRKCGRSVFLGFRWAAEKKIPGRIIRLFNRGHLEEARFIALMTIIGAKVYQQDENGKQFRISWAAGHAGGSTDSILVDLPTVQPGQPVLGEYKTHNDKSFTDLDKKGVKEAKPDHYIQMQLYMGKMGLTLALYLAVNKNNDELYAEWIIYDHAVCEQYLDRGEKIVFLRKPPEKISNSPSWFECRMCDYHGLCHKKQKCATNCRTCKWSVPRDDGEGVWVCAHETNVDALGNPFVLDPQAQLKACEKWEVLEGLN